MRSTICRTRKSGVDHQTSEETDRVPARMRRFVALPITEKIKHDELKKLTDGAVGRSRSKEVADFMPTVLKDFSNKYSTSNSNSPIHTIDGILMIQAEREVDDFSIEEYVCSIFTPPDTWCVVKKKKGEREVNRMTMELIAYEKQSSEALMLKNSWASTHSASDASGSITDVIEDFGVSISRSELKSPHQKVPTEIGKDSEEEEVHVSSQYSEAGKLQHQSLQVDKANQVDLAMSIFQSQGKTKSTGICDPLKQKIQILCACALLGLGFQSLGLEHDFFYALML
ncbi:hypothetical protein CsSME_00042525 [Camellia sinensis var. sinensis]|uniref:Uncharacterized protein n=1 Tax=Camellia sinensis var. sinensis TaxID=542762 RepID=A0A4S4D9A2_CAMSN|nr:hypothetical protein TEA_007026 [Camellia sinensis var. sinensis]